MLSSFFMAALNCATRCAVLQPTTPLSSEIPTCSKTVQQVFETPPIRTITVPSIDPLGIERTDKLEISVATVRFNVTYV